MGHKNRNPNLLLLPFAASRSAKLLKKRKMWRKRVGVEPTIHPAKGRIAGFEDREDHRTPCASICLEANDNTEVKLQLQCGPVLAQIAWCR